MARSDSEVLTHYLEGRVRGDGEDRLQIRKLKDVGYLACTIDLRTGREYLRTTALGRQAIYLDSSIAEEMEACLEELCARERRVRRVLSGLRRRFPRRPSRARTPARAWRTPSGPCT